MKQLLLTGLTLLVFASNNCMYALEEDSVKKAFYIPPVKYEASLKDFILPVSLLSVGVVMSLSDAKDIFSIEDKRKYGDTSWEYLLLGGVAGSMFAFDCFIEAEHKPGDQAFLLLLSAGLSLAPAYIIKENSDSRRPDGGPNSFPSGHAATGFMIAHVLNKEFRNSNPWVAYGGYVVASAVSISRIARNKHWVCDILAGAGLGILGTELAYMIYFPIRNKITENLNRSYGKEISLSPLVTTENFGLNMSFRF